MLFKTVMTLEARNIVAY